MAKGASGGGGHDIEISVGSNLSEIMSQIDAAMQAATKLETKLTKVSAPKSAGNVSSRGGEYTLKLDSEAKSAFSKLTNALNSFKGTGPSSAGGGAITTLSSEITQLKSVLGSMTTMMASQKAMAGGLIPPISQPSFASAPQLLGRIQPANLNKPQPLVSAEMRQSARDATRVARMRNNEIPGTHPVVEDAFRRAVVWGAVSAAIYKSIDAATTFLGIMIDMDKQIADLRKTISGTDQEFKRLVDSSINIARTYKVGTKEVLDAVEIFSKQFKDSGDLEKLSRSAVLFSNISGLGIKDSAETITATIQQYNMSVAESSLVTDAWANVSANAAVTIGDLGKAVGNVGGVAETAGISFHKLNALIGTAVASTGKSGVEVGNALKRIFERTFAPENAKAIESKGIGLMSKDKPGQFRDFDSILQDVNSKWKTLSDTEKKNLAIAFAGARQYDVFMAIMNNYSEVVKLTDVSLNSLGAAQRQNERIGQTFTKSLQSLRNEFDAMARNLGSTVLPVLGLLVNGFTGFLKILNEVPGAIHAISAALAVLSASQAGKFIFNQFGSITNSAGGKTIANNILGKTLSPFIVGAGTSEASFSLTQGIKSLGGGLYGARGLAGGAATFGGNAAMAAGAGASTTALIAGMTTLIASLVVAAAAITAFAFALDQSKDKTRTFVDETFGKMFSITQEAGSMSRSATRLKTIASGGNLTEEQKLEVGTIVTSISKNPKIARLLEGSGVSTDFEGKVVGSTEAITKLANSISGLSSADVAAARIEVLAKAVDESFIPSLNSLWTKFKIFAGISSETRTGQQNIATSANANWEEISSNLAPAWMGTTSRTGKRIRLTRESINARSKDILLGLSDSSLKDTEKISKVASILGLNEDELGPEQKAILFNFAKRSSELSQTGIENRQRLRPILIEQGKKVYEDAIRAGKSPREAKTLSDRTIKQQIAILKGPFQGGLKENYIPDINEPGVLYDPGATGAGKDKFKEFVKSPVTRIDLELQKSLMDTSTNFKNLGSEVDIASDAVNSYRKAIIDLGTEINKSAGPAEEEAAFKRQEKIFNLKQKLKDVQGGKISGGVSEADKLAEQIFQEENIAQSIQKQNEERQKGLEILKKQYETLKAVATYSKIIQEGLSSTLSSAPSILQQGIVQRGDLDVEKDYLLRRMAQIEGQKNTGTTEVDIKNYETTRQNQLRQSRYELEKINRQMDEINRKTNLWNTLLDKVGQAGLSDIASRLSRIVTSYGSEQGAMGSMNAGMVNNGLYGQSNKQYSSLGSSSLSYTAAGAGAAGAAAAAAMSYDMAKKNIAKEDARTKGQGGSSAGMAAAAGLAQANQNNNTKYSTNAQMAGAYLSAMLVGAGVGSQMTQAQNKQGQGGQIGGAVGGAVGMYFAEYGGTIWGPLLGGLIGSMFDKTIDPLKKPLDDLLDNSDKVIYQLEKIEKGLNTINDTMENLINAPANFVLPIPKGILEGSISAQSAIAAPLQAGGIITRSGPAFLHAGETINPASGSGGGMNIKTNITINGVDKNADQIASEVMEKVNSEMYRQSMRAGTYKSRF